MILPFVPNSVSTLRAVPFVAAVVITMGIAVVVDEKDTGNKSQSLS